MDVHLIYCQCLQWCMVQLQKMQDMSTEKTSQSKTWGPPAPIIKCNKSSQQNCTNLEQYRKKIFTRTLKCSYAANPALARDGLDLLHAFTLFLTASNHKKHQVVFQNYCCRSGLHAVTWPLPLLSGTVCYLVQWKRAREKSLVPKIYLRVDLSSSSFLFIHFCAK